MNPEQDRPPMDESDPSRIELLLQRSMDGELRPSERAELDRALEQDASLRQMQMRGELQAEFFQADREHDLPPPLALDFADRVIAGLDESEVAGAVENHASRSRESDEPLSLGPWIVAAAILLGVLLVGQFLTRQDDRKVMRAGTREAEKILRELDRSSEARAAGQALPESAGERKR